MVHVIQFERVELSSSNGPHINLWLFELRRFISSVLVAYVRVGFHNTLRSTYLELLMVNRHTLLYFFYKSVKNYEFNMCVYICISVGRNDLT